MSEKMAINELFYSLQGEGAWAGTPMLFVRMAGCNLRCEWCDQPDSISQDYRGRHSSEAGGLKSEMMDVDDVAEWAYNMHLMEGVHRLCLTGGEPTMHNSVHRFLVEIYQFFNIHLETNGTLEPKWIDLVDWICVSPKREHLPIERMYHRANELKYIVDEKFTLGEVWSDLGNFPDKLLFFQPVDIGKDTGDGTRLGTKAMQMVFEAYKKNMRPRLSLQTHKMLGIR